MQFDAIPSPHSTSSVKEDVVIRAAKLFLLSSFANPKGSLTITDALSIFGLNPNDVRNDGKCNKCSEYVSKYMHFYMNSQAEITAESSIEEKKKLLRKIFELLYPCKVKNMRILGNMAGLDIGVGNQSKCKDYHICYRMYTKTYKDLKQKESALELNRQITIEHQINATTTSSEGLTTTRTMSPLTVSPANSSTGSTSFSTLTAPNSTNDSASLQENLFDSQLIRTSGSQVVASHINSRSFVGVTECRRTAHQAHIHRREKQACLKTEKLAHKLGYFLYSEAKQKRNPLRELQSPEQCAEAVNQLFGVDAVSGYGLKQAFRRGDKLGSSPPRPGRNTIIPEEDLKDLASLFHTMSSLEQVTAGPRLDRPTQISLLGNIVNTKHHDEGKPEQNIINLYRYTEVYN